MILDGVVQQRRARHARLDWHRSERLRRFAQHRVQCESLVPAHVAPKRFE
jgi:hypothetical protein